VCACTSVHKCSLQGTASRQQYFCHACALGGTAELHSAVKANDVSCADTHTHTSCTHAMCLLLFVYRYIDKVLICKCAQRGGPCEAYHDEVSSSHFKCLELFSSIENSYAFSSSSMCGVVCY
jgi:hypothetical protein